MAFLLLALILSALSGWLVAMYVGPTNALKAGPVAGLISSVALCTFLSFKMLFKKKLFLHFGALFLALGSVLLSCVGGCLFGLIPVAILSGMDEKE